MKRNRLKQKLGTNKINQAWRNRQIRKYGFKAWLNMYNKCVGAKFYKDAYML